MNKKSDTTGVTGHTFGIIEMAFHIAFELKIGLSHVLLLFQCTMLAVAVLVHRSVYSARFYQ